MIPIKQLLLVMAGVLLCASTTNAQFGGNVYSYAATGVQGFSGDGGPAINAQFMLPQDIKIDKNGYVYILDPATRRIRKIDPVTNIVTTVVGNGINGTSGDGGPATLAGFHNMAGFALDTFGNIYIAEDWDDRIRKVDISTGIINTICGDGNQIDAGDGGLAINATLYNPTDIHVDVFGNIYIVVESKLRKIDGQTGIITTICGNGTPGSSGDGGLAVNALLNYVTDICEDADGNLLIMDAWSYAVRKIDKNTGIITRVVGNNSNGDSGDGGLATNASLAFVNTISTDLAGNIYLGSQFKIRKVDAYTGIINTYAGIFGGQFYEGVPASNLDLSYSVQDVASDVHGNIYYTHDTKVYRITAAQPAINSIASNFSVQLYDQCNGPQLIVTTPQYNSNLSLHTYYGDGTANVQTFVSSYNVGYLPFSHAYGLTGTYPLKHVLYNNSSAIDSVEYQYDYNLCRSISASLFNDVDNDCTYNPLFDEQISQPLLFQVDSNNIPIDTLSVSSGFTYNAYGNTGDVYTFNIIGAPYGLQSACGIVIDTLHSVIYNNSHQAALQCGTINGFDISVSANQLTAANVSHAQIVVNNAYCNATNSQLTMTFSPKYAFSQAYPSPTSQNGNILVWDLTYLSSSQYIDIQFTYNGQILTPGDTVQTTFTLTPTIGDVHMANNIIIRHDTVTGPYDPNAVYVSPTGCVEPGTQLQYTVTFENMGNDTAHNIYVMDTLSTGVNMQSFRLIAASHLMNVTKVSYGSYNILKFEFPNIDLPDSSSAARHGMVMYTIDVDNNWPDGATITNKAGIYFDYMPAVLTNEAETDNCIPAGINTINSRQEHILLYPNPAANELTIKSDKEYTSYTITNSIGQVMMQHTLDGKEAKVNIKSLSPGLYYINLKGDSGNEVRKFIKI